MMTRSVLPFACGCALISQLAAAPAASAEDASLAACVNLQSGLVRVVPGNTSCRSSEGRLAWATPDENVVRVAVTESGSAKTAAVPELGTVTSSCEATGVARARIDGEVDFGFHIGAGATGDPRGFGNLMPFNAVVEPGSLVQRTSNLWGTITRTEIGAIWKVEVTLQKETMWVTGGLGGTEHLIPCAATAVVTRMN